VRGRIVCNWRRTAKTFELELIVPPGTGAKVIIPSDGLLEVEADGEPITRVPGVENARFEAGRVICNLSAGHYSLVSRVAPKNSF
jgi:hypothetical protein